MQTANLVLDVVFWTAVIWMAVSLVRHLVLVYLDNKIMALNSELVYMRQHYRRAKIEQHSGVFYLFDVDTNEFLAQGRDAQELCDAMCAEMTISLVAGEPDVIQRFQQSVPQTNTA